ncbi:MAG TPA: hypothetical protein VGQ87_01865 [Patescibacteria group bacterium]|nr:hypothetical protein [Patescibacteria group bacterium]
MVYHDVVITCTKCGKSVAPQRLAINSLGEICIMGTCGNCTWYNTSEGTFEQMVRNCRMKEVTDPGSLLHLPPDVDLAAVILPDRPPF